MKIENKTEIEQGAISACKCKYYESCPHCFHTTTIGGFKVGTKMPEGYKVNDRSYYKINN